ncbi:MAG: hypothetical protein C0448_01255 [Sphingobacteriaceae bacterium]|nr:hypothetical protein [Sphingobacteriaceae bacterium]
MKSIIYFSQAVLIGLSFLLYSFVTNPPCESDEFVDSCAPALGNFVFIKTFNINVDKPGNKTEYSYVLSRDSEYKIVVCDQNDPGKKMIINFYDRSKKLIASNYLKSSKKIFPTVSYKCAATGVYYVEAFFEGDKSGCGINILGFKK